MARFGTQGSASPHEHNELQNENDSATGVYKGRRVAPKCRGIKLPNISVQAVIKPFIGKPAIAASVAIASFVSIAAASSAQQSASVTAASSTDLRDLAEADPELTIASSSADAAVMEAAEVLSSASTLDREDKAIQAAAAELEALLAQISGKAETQRDDVASRSFTRGSLELDADLASSELGAPSAAQVQVAAEEILGIKIRPSGADADLPVASDVPESVTSVPDSASSSESALDKESAQLGSATNPNAQYVGKHAATDDTQKAEAAQEAADSSQSTQNTVVVPTGNEVVPVAVADATLESVVEATEKLRSLLSGSASPEVTSAAEIEKNKLEEAWAEAESLTLAASNYGNGQIPMSSLKELATAPGQYLRADAAFMFNEMNTAFKAEFGRDIQMTDSYRSYSLQVATKANKGWLAAAPGTSNHGWGLALDLKGPEAQWNTAERNWLVANGSEYGWISPEWAQTSKPEPWHWEFAGDSVSTAGLE